MSGVYICLVDPARCSREVLWGRGVLWGRCCGGGVVGKCTGPVPPLSVLVDTHQRSKKREKRGNFD